MRGEKVLKRVAYAILLVLVALIAWACLEFPLLSFPSEADAVKLEFACMVLALIAAFFTACVVIKAFWSG